jgi:hypothetical protein
MKKFAFAALVAGVAGLSQAAVVTEGFNNVAGLAGAGWRFSNQSTLAPVGQTWRQGNASSTNSIGPAQAGPGDSYALANFTDTGSTAASGATISNWMITPLLNFGGVAHTLSFYTRTATGNPFPDRLQVRLSTTTNLTGGTATSVGAFTTLLLDINPSLLSGAANYPDVWTQLGGIIPANLIPTTGYIAFRYFVTNAGANGANSNIIGVDTLSIAPVPAPSALTLLPVAGLLVGRRRR